LEKTTIRQGDGVAVHNQNRCYSASSLTDSLRSVVRLRRAVRSAGAESYQQNRGITDGESCKAKTEKDAALPFFHRLRPPDEHHRNQMTSGAQVSGGETRQDYKDPRRFPLVAPSCALLFLPSGLPVSFRCCGRGFSFHAWHSVPGRQFAPSWTVCTNPPFSPTAAPHPVTIILSPTRTGVKKHHWQRPLVT